MSNAAITVVASHGNAAATTDARGAFKVPMPKLGGEAVALQVSAAGYASVSRRILIPTHAAGYAAVVLRLVDQTQAFTLPTQGESATFTLARDGASITLTLPADSVMDANQRVATGDANLALTLWSPAKDMRSAPGLLRAAARDGDPRDARPIQLLSYGMVDIDLTQNGQKLQVIPGQALGLVLQTTAARRDAIATRPASVKTWPSLWTLNPNSGLWEEDVGDATFDVTTGEMHASLRHLSSKNLDEPITVDGPPTGDSGCFMGRVLGACGQAIAGAQVRINIENGTGAAVNAAYTTDSAGMYRANWSPSGHNTYFHSASFQSHVTDMSQSPHDPAFGFESRPAISGLTPVDGRAIFVAMTCADVSGSCQNSTCACFNDPSNPAGCMDALEAADPNVVTGYNPCWVNPLGNSWQGPCFDDLLTGGTVDLHFNTVWKNWPKGDLCSNCWPLLDLVFKDVAGDQAPGCTGMGAYGTGCCPAVPPSGAYDVCDDPSATNRKQLGEYCRKGVDVCCPASGDPSLQCSDDVCVPTTDPN